MAAPQLPPLAEPSDVATALGVADVTALPSTMQIRMDTTLAKVSRRFRKEAERFFSPGVYTHTLLVQRGAVRLMEVPNLISEVRVRSFSTTDALPDLSDDWVLSGGSPSGGGGLLWQGQGEPTALNNGPTFRVEGMWIVWDDWHRWRLNGRLATITYSWDTPVPQDVITAVADITGRNLTLDPLSAVRQSKTLRSKHFEQQMADWVVSGDTGFTEDDLCQARSYRYPAPPIIIANMDTSERGISSAFLADGSW